jgi:hypothetical protein
MKAWQVSKWQRIFFVRLRFYLSSSWQFIVCLIEDYFKDCLMNTKLFHFSPVTRNLYSLLKYGLRHFLSSFQGHFRHFCNSVFYSNFVLIKYKELSMSITVYLGTKTKTYKPVIIYPILTENPSMSLMY